MTEGAQYTISLNLVDITRIHIHSPAVVSAKDTVLQTHLSKFLQIVLDMNCALTYSLR